MAEINTTQGPMDDSLLMLHTGLVDNDDERTASVEYCLSNCPGAAHNTGQPDSVSHFCNLHVHRSVHVTLKRTPTIAGEISSFA